MNKLLEYLGVLMLLGGIAGAVYFFAFFSVTVTTEPVSIMGQSIGGQTVNNIGLMADRQNGLMLSIGSAVLGTLFLFAGHSMTEKMKTPRLSKQTPTSTLCASCGKFYEGNPTFCPHCGQKI